MSAEHTPSALSPVLATALLEDAMGHLGAAVAQLLPTDDQIIADHIKIAHSLVAAVWKAQRK